MRLSLELLRDTLDHSRKGESPHLSGDPCAENSIHDSRLDTCHLTLIQDEINRLDALIGGILLFSRLDLQENPLQFSPGRAEVLLAERSGGLKPLMDARRQRLGVQIRDLSETKMDSRAMVLALDNILDNALKYTPTGGDIRVRASVANSEFRKQSVLRLEVSNTANELSQDTLNSILNPFHRGEDSSVSGSGLGVPISKKIIELHGGVFSLRSNASGFTVIVELPVYNS